MSSSSSYSSSLSSLAAAAAADNEGGRVDRVAAGNKAHQQSKSKQQQLQEDGMMEEELLLQRRQVEEEQEEDDDQEQQPPRSPFEALSKKQLDLLDNQLLVTAAGGQGQGGLQSSSSSCRRRSWSSRSSSSAGGAGDEQQELQLQLVCEPLPPLLEANSAEELRDLVRRKLAQVCIIFDFGDPLAELKQKEVKRAALHELIALVAGPAQLLQQQQQQQQQLQQQKDNKVVSSSSTATTSSEVQQQQQQQLIAGGLGLEVSLYPDLVQAFSANCFRPLAPPSAADFDPEEDEPALEPAWPHLALTYELALRWLESPRLDLVAAKRLLDAAFVGQLVELFESEDPRERDCLKALLHRVYARLVTVRAVIRLRLGHVFARFAYEQERHPGLAELLEFLGAVVSGFALPLKQEHRDLLRRSLLPLHTARSLGAFHPQLAYCVVQFLEKEAALAEPVIRQLLRYWPRVHSPKEVMFLNELEELLDVCEPAEFRKVANLLFSRLASCAACPHFQVAERALYFWNNEYVMGLVADNVTSLLPLLLPPLLGHAHWNRTIHGLAYNALKLLAECDQRAFDACVRQLRSKPRPDDQEAERQEKWRRIEQLAARNRSSSSSSSLLSSSSAASAVSSSLLTSKVAAPSCLA